MFLGSNHIDLSEASCEIVVFLQIVILIISVQEM